jgi:hypothetical protein
MNPNEQDKEAQASFTPASNPFLQNGNTKDVQVGHKETTLVGEKAENKKDSENTQAPKVPEELLFQWQAPEFAYTSKPFGWYIGIFAFFAGLIALAIWFQQWISIVLLAIMAIAISVWANRKPKTLIYKITNYGIEVEDKKYLFDDFRAFYEYKDYNQPTIDLVPVKRFGTLVSLPLATPDAQEVKEAISHMIPETEHHEDIADKIFRRLRF